MSLQSLFVKEVHLSTIKKMMKQGKNIKQITSHLKSVWFDDNQIQELINEAKDINKLNTRDGEMGLN